ncbi:hypothetical protein Tco_0422547 [Tanacetum coccineum]
MLATAHARIDVFSKKISLEVGTEQITFNINKKESPAIISPVYVINSLLEINELYEPRDPEELLLSNDDLDIFPNDNDLLPNLESHDNMFLLPTGSARFNDDSSEIFCNPNSNSSIRNNMVGFARNLHVFIEGHQFLIDFIIENINEFVEEGLTEVLFGQPFKENVGIIDDTVNEVLWFKIRDDKTIFNMPRAEKRFGEEYKHDQEVTASRRYVLWKPSRDFTRPLGPPSGLKGLLHMLNVTVIPTEGILSLLKMEINLSAYYISYIQKKSSREFLVLILLFYLCASQAYDRIHAMTVQLSDHPENEHLD